jgi:hypothetical protein
MPRVKKIDPNDTDPARVILGKASDQQELWNDIDRELAKIGEGKDFDFEEVKRQVLLKQWRALEDKASRPSVRTAIYIGLVSALATIAEIHVSSARRSPPSLVRVHRFADFAPLGSRKPIRAMLADYQDEILRLHEAGRFRAARWNKLLAVITTGCLLLRSPVDALVRIWRGQHRIE